MNWLIHYTCRVSDLRFPTENGPVILRAFHHWNFVEIRRGREGIPVVSPDGSTDFPYWSLCGFPADEEVEIRSRFTGDKWLGWVISFSEPIQLAPERMEVTIECHHPAVMGYFEELLVEIRKRWPEATVGTARPLRNDFPKMPGTLEKYRRVFAVVVQTRERWRDLWEEGDLDNPSPKMEDYKDAIANEMNWKPSDRTLRKIIRFGDESLLV